MSSLPSTTSAKIKPWMIYACGAFGVGLLVGWGACWLLHYLQARSEKIDQSALATFAAGLMAVGAALAVGFKQTEIQRQQTAIQKRQVDLQHIQTNIQLLKNRAEAIKKLSDFHRSHLSLRKEVTEEEWTFIYDGLNQARLVYPEILSDLFKIYIEKIWKRQELIK